MIVEIGIVELDVTDDLRDKTGIGYVVFLSGKGYRWIYTDPSGPADDWSREAAFATRSSALRDAADDWDNNGPDSWDDDEENRRIKRVSATMRAVATRLEKKEQSDAR